MADYLIDPDEYYRRTGKQLPLGLRLSNNAFNIKYYPGAERNQSRWPGLTGPSTARDQGDPQMRFTDLESSGVAGANLLRRKYDAGATTPRQLIAGPQGWTPGYTGAAENVARIAGVGVDQDAQLNTPEGLRRFLPALFEQEHGPTAAKMAPTSLWDSILQRITGGGGAPLGVPRMSLGGAPATDVAPTMPPPTLGPDIQQAAAGGPAIPAPMPPVQTQVPTAIAGPGGIEDYQTVFPPGADPSIGSVPVPQVPPAGVPDMPPMPPAMLRDSTVTGAGSTVDPTDEIYNQPAAPKGVSGGFAPAVAGGGGFLDALGRSLYGFTHDPVGLYGMGLIANIKNPGEIPAALMTDKRAQQELALRQQEAVRHAEEFKQTFGLRQQEFGLQKEAGERAAETYGREREQYDIDKKLFNEVFPGGQLNRDHPLVRDLTDAEAMTVYGMGPTKGMDYLRQQQMLGAKARSDIAAQNERLRQAENVARGRRGLPPIPAPPGSPFTTQGAPAAAAAPVTQRTPDLGYGPPTAAPTAAPPTAAPPAVASAAPPAAAPAPSAGAPSQGMVPYGPGVPAEPRITYAGRNLTLDQAREEAEIYRNAKVPNEVLEKAIAAAEKDAGVPQQVKQDAAKTDQAFTIISNALDRYNKVIQKQDKAFNYGGFVGQSADRDSAMGEYNQIILTMKDLYSLGQLSKSDIELATTLPDPRFSIVGPAGFNVQHNLKERTQAAVERIKERLQDVRNTKVGAIGLPQAATPTQAAPAAPAAPTKRQPDEVRREGGKTYHRFGKSWFEVD